MQGSGDHGRIAVGACADARLGRARAYSRGSLLGCKTRASLRGYKARAYSRGACSDARLGRIWAYGRGVDNWANRGHMEVFLVGDGWVGKAPRFLKKVALNVKESKRRDLSRPSVARVLSHTWPDLRVVTF
ncbi:hypothetical protein M0R45_030479 [Rubus argutus]|uniref:Uncharacterized protein n=1 Tax=Rubus argutus TaxID=59490 RepID=A0AAW1WF92_RUBAR